VKNILYCVLLLGAVATTAACNGKENIGATQTDNTTLEVQPASTDSQLPNGTSGKVLETYDAAGYTYVLVDSGTDQKWAVAPAFSVTVGDNVIVPSGMPMHNYRSETLKREFKTIYFVETILNASNTSLDSPQMTQEHPPIEAQIPAEIDLSNIKKIENGHTIAEIYAAKQEFAGKNIVLRGKVVKFSPNIMGINWIHIQDGSGSQQNATNDLTVTSDANVSVGDTVVVKGPLTLNKDFGFGYRYTLIVEEAEIVIE
jgi:hypothetical protein